MNPNIANIRKDYTLRALELADVQNNPITQFEHWFQQALKAEVNEPNAMQIATVDANNFPNSRIVLLKDITADGLSFYTNYNSKKGQELANNPQIAVIFFWPELERQVRIRGIATKLSAENSDAYFASRPRGSQIGAWVSEQSSTLPNREVLEERQRMFEAKFEGHNVPRPPHWGGYLIQPVYFEFWQGRASRLHDRLVYHLDDTNSWQINRISP